MALQVLLAQANILIMEVPQQDNRPQVGITACEWVVLVAMDPQIATVMVRVHFKNNSLLIIIYYFNVSIIMHA